MRLYKTYVRPDLEHCQAPWQEGDKKVLQKVQERVIRMISNMKGRCYQDRLKDVGITTLEERRRSGNMIATYRILTGKNLVSPNHWLQMVRQTGTRQSTGYLCLEKPIVGKLEFRRNSLPDWVRMSPSINCFKNTFT